MIMHKFGGSSLATAEKIENVSNIITCKDEGVVVSASAKTTANLQKAIDSAIAGENYNEIIDSIFEHHDGIIKKLISNDKEVTSLILKDLENIKHILNTITITGFCVDSLRFFILGFGEIWSANILTAYLKSKNKKAYMIDASECLIVDDSNYPVAIKWDLSLEKLEHIQKNNPADIYVITGFIAQNKQGKRTILGLNCSDYSAAIFARLFQAYQLYIWTDVAGVYSANPQIVPDAKPLKQLTYKEALELAYFGASVVHPLTISPMALENIPIYIKSSYAPDEQGTKISTEKDENQKLIKGLTSIPNVAVVRIQGAGMIGVSGISVKVFGALERAKISVMMISQASSEYSICFAINSLDANKAKEFLQEEFEREIKNNLIEEIIVEKHYSLITAVGEGMKAKIGSLSTILTPLKLANINIHAVAQGSSERSVTFAIKTEDERLCVQTMHRHYNNISNDVAIAVIGAGNIGKEFIQRIKQTYENLYAKGMNVILIGVTNSKLMRISYDNLLFKNTNDLLARETEEVNLDKLLKFMFHSSATKKIVIDTTASEDVSNTYINFLEKGINIITPNKYANSGNYEYYKKLRKTANDNGVSFLYETNVCAGLPVINTLQNMVQSGDTIKSIKGIFSGTLCYLFSQLNNGVVFSDAVKMAYDAGYTEPDPRHDLSGMDVARKTIILAREIGLNISINDLTIENLVPEELRDCSVEEFFEKLPTFNNQIMQQIQDKKQNLPIVHYVGTIDSGKASVGIKAYSDDSPLANVKGTDNIVMISTQRYSQPMVIQGAGAGVDVTAAGVYADVITAIKQK